MALFGHDSRMTTLDMNRDKMNCYRSIGDVPGSSVEEPIKDNEGKIGPDMVEFTEVEVIESEKPHEIDEVLGLTTKYGAALQSSTIARKAIETR
ncbi:hypothetical protein ABG067_007629 [Albugo candida]